MKSFLLILLSSVSLSSVGQSDVEGKGAFVVFTGMLLHDPYRGEDYDREVSLRRLTSLGLELGLRYERIIAPQLSGSLSLGADLAWIRNQIIGGAEFQESRSFTSNVHLYKYVEVGVHYRTQESKDAIRFYGGYRLNNVRRATSGFREVYSDHEFGIESTVNPQTNLVHSIVFRPELEIKPKKLKRAFVIGLQVVFMASSDNKQDNFVEGTYFYRSNSVESTGNVEGSLVHLTLLGQIYL